MSAHPSRSKREGSVTLALLEQAAMRLDREGRDVNEMSARARAHRIQAEDYAAYHTPGEYRTAMPNGDGSVTLICVGCWWCTP